MTQLFNRTPAGVEAHENARIDGLHRLRVLDALAAGMSPLLGSGRVMADPPTIGAALSASVIGQVPVAMTTGDVFYDNFDGPGKWARQYSLLGATWGKVDPNSVDPFAVGSMFKPTNAHEGDGTDHAANPIGNSGARVRFLLSSPKLELFVRCGASTSGFRLKVNGEYAQAATLGANGDGLVRYIPIQWGDGTATNRDQRLYELEFCGGGAAFGGVVIPLIESMPNPWDGQRQLRIVLHGDEQAYTVAQPAATVAASTEGGGFGTALSNALGQPDMWVASASGTGFITRNGKSTFMERVDGDVIAQNPDVVIHLGGRADWGAVATPAAYTTLVRAWIDRILAANPKTIIVLCDPFGNLSNDRWADQAIVWQGLYDAAAFYPQNVIHTNSVGLDWFGFNGHLGAETADGPADWILGTDERYLSLAGVWSVAQRTAGMIQRGIKRLAANQLDVGFT